jgi:hypothetical protein
MAFVFLFGPADPPMHCAPAGINPIKLSAWKK